MKKSLKYPFGGITIWLYQRFTAFFMSAYFFLIGLIIFINSPISFLEWSNIFDPFWMKISTLMFFYVMYFHSWIGIQHIIDDYIKNNLLRKIIIKIFFIAVFLQVIMISFFLLGGFRFETI